VSLAGNLPVIQHLDNTKAKTILQILSRDVETVRSLLIIAMTAFKGIISDE
jgi:hypothetical protein